jgi:hypothetical protein
MKELTLGRCIASYSDVLPLNIVSSESFTRHNFPELLATNYVEGVQTSMNSVVASRELLTVTSTVLHRWFFKTNGSLIDRCAECATHRTVEGGFGYK